MKTLAWDLETSSHFGGFFGLYDQNIGLNQIKEFSRVICFASQWEENRNQQPLFFSEFHDGRSKMIECAWNLLDTADVVISYNGKSFDTKVMNKEFYLEGYGPPSPYQHIDLYSAVKANFRFASNKLEHVAEISGIGSKESTGGFDLWMKCLEGDPKAWARMKKYNRQDVSLLWDLRDKLLPWIPNYPNKNLYDGSEGFCPRCGSDLMEKRGFSYTGTAKYQRYCCKACGGWTKSSKRVDGTETRGIVS